MEDTSAARTRGSSADRGGGVAMVVVVVVVRGGGWGDGDLVRTEGCEECGMYET